MIFLTSNVSCLVLPRWSVYWWELGIEVIHYHCVEVHLKFRWDNASFMKLGTSVFGEYMFFLVECPVTLFMSSEQLWFKCIVSDTIIVNPDWFFIPFFFLNFLFCPLTLRWALSLIMKLVSWSQQKDGISLLTQPGSVCLFIRELRSWTKRADVE